MHKLTTLLFFVLAYNLSFSQKMKLISNYHLLTNKETGIVHFRINNDTFSFNKLNEYFKNNELILKCPDDSIVFLEIYDKKFFVFSFYHNSESNISLGTNFRTKERILFVSINDISKRWTFDLESCFNSKSIIFFDEKNGELILQRKLKSKKGK